MQSSETLRNSLGLNYESPALTAELETEAADQITLPRESCREHTEQQRSVLPRSAEIGSREPFSVCSRRKNHAKSSLMAPQLCSDIRHVRQPSHGGALVVRRKVRVLTRNRGAFVTDNLARHEIGNTGSFEHRHRAMPQRME